MTTIKNGLPKEYSKDGLSPLAAHLVSTPRTMRLAIAVVDCSKIALDVDTKERSATVRILRFEEVTPEDAPTVERLLRRAVNHRLGKDVLPYELESALADIFVDGYWIDKETGEIKVPVEQPDDDQQPLFSDGADDVLPMGVVE